MKIRPAMERPESDLTPTVKASGHGSGSLPLRALPAPNNPTRAIDPAVGFLRLERQCLGH
jgi:hypothetical protein